MSAPVVEAPVVPESDSSKVSSVNAASESTPTVDTAISDDNLKEKASKQVEFYFADSNLPYDKFMWGLHSANEDNWIPLATIASFKRMRPYQEKGTEWLVSAIREKSVGILEVDESNTKIRRTTEVQEPVDQFGRSIYVKGFGDEEPNTQAKLEEFFGQYGSVNSVRMRRTDNKLFKGSVFVEFTDLETVNKFLNADPKPTYGEKELLIMTKEAYCDMKIKEKGLRGKAADQRRNNMRRNGFDAFREMREKASGSTAATTESTKETPNIFLEFMGDKVRVYEDESGDGYVKEEEVPEPKSGSMLKFEGCDDTMTVKFPDIKNPLKEKFTKAPYVSYARGSSFGVCAFEDKLSEDDIKFVQNAIPKLGEKNMTWTVLPDEDMKAIQIERANAAARNAYTAVSDRRGTSNRGRGRGRGSTRGNRGGRGGRGGGRGGRKPSGTQENGDEKTGEKRKRAVEPDGGPDVGVRGTAAPPTIKKAKTEGETSS